MTEYSHTQVLQIFPKLKGRTLITWVELGLIVPVKDAHGRGSSRSYSYKNLVEIGVVQELRSYYIPVQVIKNIIQHKDIMKGIAKKELVSVSGETSDLIIDVLLLTSRIDTALARQA